MGSGMTASSQRFSRSSRIRRLPRTCDSFADRIRAIPHESHCARRLRGQPETLRGAIGAALYDLWLDCLLDTVRACDPECFPEAEAAWEEVMMVGIHYLCANYEGRHGR